MVKACRGNADLIDLDDELLGDDLVLPQLVPRVGELGHRRVPASEQVHGDALPGRQLF